MAFQAQSLAHAQAPTNNSYAQASTSSYAQASKNQGSIPTPYYAPSQATSNTSAQYSYANVEPTPMERWEGENAQQSPYNAVGQYKYLGKKRWCVWRGILIWSNIISFTEGKKEKE